MSFIIFLVSLPFFIVIAGETLELTRVYNAVDLNRLDRKDLYAAIDKKENTLYVIETAAGFGEGGGGGGGGDVNSSLNFTPTQSTDHGFCATQNASTRCDSAALLSFPIFFCLDLDPPVHLGPQIHAVLDFVSCPFRSFAALSGASSATNPLNFFASVSAATLRLASPDASFFN